MIAAFGWSDLAYLALTVFLLLTGLALAYGALRLGGTLGRASSLLEGTEKELLPVISKLGGTVDRVNGLVTRPIERLAGLTAGARHAASSLRARGDWREAVRTGKEEAERREQD